MKMYNKSIVNAKQRHNDTVETLFANHGKKKVLFKRQMPIAGKTTAKTNFQPSNKFQRQRTHPEL